MALLFFSGGISRGFDLNTWKICSRAQLNCQENSQLKKNLTNRVGMKVQIFFICIIFDEYVHNTHKKPVGTTLYFRVIVFLELQTCPLIWLKFYVVDLYPVSTQIYFMTGN